LSGRDGVDATKTGRGDARNDELSGRDGGFVWCDDDATTKDRTKVKVILFYVSLATIVAIVLHPFIVTGRVGVTRRRYLRVASGCFVLRFQSGAIGTVKVVKPVAG